MNFCEKLDKLMEERGINKHMLAIESKIPYTTILSFYDRGYENVKLSTLRALATYFHVTLDYLADDDVTVLVEDKKDEREIAKLYGSAPTWKREAVEKILRGE